MAIICGEYITYKCDHCSWTTTAFDKSSVALALNSFIGHLIINHSKEMNMNDKRIN